jgi:hypothetical protein
MTTQDHLSPGAKEIVKPGMTPCQQAQALNQKQLSTDAVKSLAHGLPEPKAVKWAAASAEKVANPAHTTDFQAIQAAKAWCQNPTPQTQQLAGQAASKAGFQTPGAWAAQAAASAGSGGTLTPHAVTGAVLLAAAQGGKPIPACPSPNRHRPQRRKHLSRPPLVFSFLFSKSQRLQLPKRRKSQHPVRMASRSRPPNAPKWPKTPNPILNSVVI